MQKSLSPVSSTDEKIDSQLYDFVKFIAENVSFDPGPRLARLYLC